jgi:MFS family permease
VIALGGFLVGFDTGMICGALLFFKPDVALNSFQQSMVVSVLRLGAMAGALSAGRAARPLGRGRALGVQGVMSLVGAWHSCRASRRGRAGLSSARRGLTGQVDPRASRRRGCLALSAATLSGPPSGVGGQLACEALPSGLQVKESPPGRRQTGARAGPCPGLTNLAREERA